MSAPDPEGDLLATHAPSASTSQVKELEEKFFALTRLFLVALLGFISLALSMNLYLYRQTREGLRRLNDARNVINHYEQVQRPFIQNFAGSLQSFASTHPDFQAIVEKYVPQQASNPLPVQATPSLRTPPPPISK